ncbi:hypothetical protein E1263_14150 [Kribbella antibiotica]|uniref:PepSY domain-containing protein n=1 Tax=Kribbella antibiotica TaxID=190195 RepID=A0A4R4ZLF2_9ACTN|nr:hypothetical protein [Kribbella antibiotica]TDD59628.1 hypothetical protein E1263_14150 [Kribbella antibiotica]
MKRLALIATTAVVLTAGGVATAYAVQSDNTPTTSPTSSPSASSSTGVPTGSLTAAKAVEQALKDVPGGVVTDVDWDNPNWELDVHTTAGWRELSYDANGKLLSNRVDNNNSDDRADDRTDDHGDDSGRDSADDRNDDRPGHDDN